MRKSKLEKHEMNRIQPCSKLKYKEYIWLEVKIE